jgi:mono/diheme cytochrome c family protein
MNKYLYAIVIVAGVLLAGLAVVIFSKSDLLFDNSGKETGFGCGVRSEPPRSELSSKDSLWVEGEKLFNANCTSCHAINEKVVGPGLINVTKRHSEKWLIAFIRDSQKMIKEGDPEAVKVYKENDESPMTSFTQLSDEQIRAVLYYIEHAPEPGPVAEAMSGLKQ